ncbi:MAG: hypothetical protein K8U57_35940 [Planctomycetes bacterium]|nr:hypothetical protein [Planctomycetota bacterium]
MTQALIQSFRNLLSHDPHAAYRLGVMDCIELAEEFATQPVDAATDGNESNLSFCARPQDDRMPEPEMTDPLESLALEAAKRRLDHHDYPDLEAKYSHLYATAHLIYSAFLFLREKGYVKAPMQQAVDEKLDTSRKTAPWSIACEDSGLLHLSSDGPKTVTLNRNSANAGPKSTVVGYVEFTPDGPKVVKLPTESPDACQDEGCTHYGNAIKCEPKPGGCIATVPASESPDVVQRVAQAMLAIFHEDSQARFWVHAMRYHLATAAVEEMRRSEIRFTNVGASGNAGCHDSREGSIPSPRSTFMGEVEADTSHSSATGPKGDNLASPAIQQPDSMDWRTMERAEQYPVKNMLLSASSGDIGKAISEQPVDCRAAFEKWFAGGFPGETEIVEDEVTRGMWQAWEAAWGLIWK